MADESLRQARPRRRRRGGRRSLALPLAHRSVRGDIRMAIMAASMGYMFVGMQLMMSMPRHHQQLAQRQSRASGPARHEPGLETPARTPEVAAKPPVETPRAASAKTYTIIAGNSLVRIAARLYGDARQWPSIMKANPGLHPRQLRAGQVIRLPRAAMRRPEQKINICAID